MSAVNIAIGLVLYFLEPGCSTSTCKNHFSCGLHSLNSAVQHDCFSAEQLDHIATTLDINYFKSDGYSNLVLLTALSKTGITESNK